MIAGDQLSARRFVWFCMAPVIVFLIVVALIPMIVAITDSLRELSLTVFTKRGAFIGLDNYRQLLGEDPKFFSAIGRTILFVVIVVPIEFALGLAIACYINREFRYRRLIITLIMLPTMVAPVVVGMMWRYLLMPSFGLLTYYLQGLGFFVETSIFSEVATAFGALVIIDVWEWTPFMMLIMLAGLTAMPEEPIEAAHLDGANAWQVLWHVQLSFLKPLIVFAVLFRAIEASKIFDTVYVLTGGSFLQGHEPPGGGLIRCGAGTTPYSGPCHWRSCWWSPWFPMSGSFSAASSDGPTS